MSSVLYVALPNEILAFDSEGNQLPGLHVSDIPGTRGEISRLASDEHGDLYVFTSTPEYELDIFKINTADYSVVWQSHMASEVGSVPVVRAGLVWVRAYWDNAIYVYDAYSGAPDHVLDINVGFRLGDPMDVSSSGQVAIGASNGFVMFEGGTHWISDDRTYGLANTHLVFAGGRVVGMDRYTWAAGYVRSSLDWEWVPDGPEGVPPFLGRDSWGMAANNGHLVVGTSMSFDDGTRPALMWVNPETGDILRWAFAPGYVEFWGTQCDPEGNVFLVAQGSLVSYFPHNTPLGGGPLWEVEFPWDLVQGTALAAGGAPPAPTFFWERRVNTIETP